MVSAMNSPIFEQIASERLRSKRFTSRRPVMDRTQSWSGPLVLMPPLLRELERTHSESNLGYPTLDKDFAKTKMGSWRQDERASGPKPPRKESLEKFKSAMLALAKTARDQEEEKTDDTSVAGASHAGERLSETTSSPSPPSRPDMSSRPSSVVSPSSSSSNVLHKVDDQRIPGKATIEPNSDTDVSSKASSAGMSSPSSHDSSTSERTSEKAGTSEKAAPQRGNLRFRSISATGLLRAVPQRENLRFRNLSGLLELPKRNQEFQQDGGPSNGLRAKLAKSDSFGKLRSALSLRSLVGSELQKKDGSCAETKKEEARPPQDTNSVGSRSTSSLTRQNATYDTASVGSRSTSSFSKQCPYSPGRKEPNQMGAPPSPVRFSQLESPFDDDFADESSLTAVSSPRSPKRANVLPQRDTLRLRTLSPPRLLDLSGKPGTADSESLASTEDIVRSKPTRTGSLRKLRSAFSSKSTVESQERGEEEYGLPEDASLASQHDMSSVGSRSATGACSRKNSLRNLFRSESSSRRVEQGPPVRFSQLDSPFDGADESSLSAGSSRQTRKCRGGPLRESPRSISVSRLEFPTRNQDSVHQDDESLNSTVGGGMPSKLLRAGSFKKLRSAFSSRTLSASKESHGVTEQDSIQDTSSVGSRSTSSKKTKAKRLKSNIRKLFRNEASRQEKRKETVDDRPVISVEPTTSRVVPKRDPNRIGDRSATLSGLELPSLCSDDPIHLDCVPTTSYFDDCSQTSGPPKKSVKSKMKGLLKTLPGIRKKKKREPRPLKSCLKKNTARPANQSNSVSFDRIEVREYEVVLSDNPAVTRGAPISLGWSYVPSISESLQAYEERKESQGPRRQKLFLTAEERAKLLEEWGFANNDIQKAIQDVALAKYQRELNKGAWGGREINMCDGLSHPVSV